RLRRRTSTSDMRSRGRQRDASAVPVEVACRTGVVSAKMALDLARNSVRALAAGAMAAGLLSLSAAIAGAQQAPPPSANSRYRGPSVRRPRTGRFVLNTLDAPSQSASTHDGLSPTQSKAIVNRYCAACHNERVRAGEVVLSGLDFSNVPAY